MTTPDTSIASRDLDIHVAKLMGYTVYHYSKGMPGFWQLWKPDGGVAIIGEGGHNVGERDTEAEAWNDVPHFSSDRSAAFELAGSFECFTMITNSTTKRCIVLIDDSQYVEGHSDEFPLLVCRAAITAKGLSL